MYDFVKDHKSVFPVQKLCKTLGLSKSAYYAYVNGKSYVDSETEIALKKEVSRLLATIHFSQ